MFSTNLNENGAFESEVLVVGSLGVENSFFIVVIAFFGIILWVTSFFDIGDLLTISKLSFIDLSASLEVVKFF